MTIPLILSLADDFPVTVTQVPQGDVYIVNGEIDVKKLKYDDNTPIDAGISQAANTIVATKVGGPPASVSGTYYIAVRYLDADDIAGSLSVATAFACTNCQQIDYTQIPVPSSEPRITKKQIWRTTAGQTNVFYLAIDDIPAVDTTATSSLTDAELQANDSMPLLNPDGTLNARRYGIPPNHKTIIITHQDRTFFVGERVFKRGMASLTQNSATATVVGHALSSNVIGREFSVPGHATTYEITAWATGGILTLDAVYSGSTDAFSRYEIKTSKEELNRIYFSERGEPESVPNINAVDLLREQSDEGYITAAMPMGAFVWIMTQSRIYRWTYQVHPIHDGNIYQTAPRGCLNQRCWTLVEGNAYIMDHQGCYKFNGGVADPISGPIQDLFRPGGGILWEHSQWFHVGHNYSEETVKFFVCLDGSTKPHNALCYHLRTGTWWIEDYAWALSSSDTISINENAVLIAGAGWETVVATSRGTLDGPKLPLEPRPTLSVIGRTKLTIAGQYTASDIIHAPVVIAKGKGVGQVRRIVYAASGVLHLDSAWHTTPDSTSDIQIGGIQWKAGSKNYRLDDVESEASRKVTVNYATPLFDAELNISLHYDRSVLPSCSTISYDRGDEVTSTIGSPYVVVDMKANNTGWAYWSIDGMQDFRGPANRTVKVVLSGTQNRDLVSLYDISISGVK